MNPSDILLQLKRRVPLGLKRNVKRVLNTGLRHHCCCCGSNVRAFGPFGRPPRAHALCPVCGAVERHRLARLVIERDALMGGSRGQLLYHFAPERIMAEFFRGFDDLRYVSADLEPGRAMETLDLCDIALDDASVDVIFCSHVLEHVPDDGAAMREIARVLKPGGHAILMVPQRSGPTFEDPSITESEKRWWAFGRFDHVRFYGDDFPDRLSAAGLSVNAVAAEDLGDTNYRFKHGLLEFEKVFIATRPP